MVLTCIICISDHKTIQTCARGRRYRHEAWSKDYFDVRWKLASPVYRPMIWLGLKTSDNKTYTWIMCKVKLELRQQMNVLSAWTGPTGHTTLNQYWTNVDATPWRSEERVSYRMTEVGELQRVTVSFSVGGTIFESDAYELFSNQNFMICFWIIISYKTQWVILDWTVKINTHYADSWRNYELIVKSA